MTPTLPPFGWSALETAALPSRPEVLDAVNRMVNNAIDPATGTISPADPWEIAPKVGWCHDYAVTKRWVLLALGFKASELLLCECIAPDGEHHLVLRVGSDVLDNLTSLIGPMRYPIVRQQSVDDPDRWEEPC